MDSAGVPLLEPLESRAAIEGQIPDQPCRKAKGHIATPLAFAEVRQAPQISGDAVGKSAGLSADTRLSVPRRRRRRNVRRERGIVAGQG